MSTASPRPDVEAVGLALAAVYKQAVQAEDEFWPASITGADSWFYSRLLLYLDRLDAGDDLHLHVAAHGPVETEAGLYKLDGIGRLRFHRHDHERTINQEGNA